MTRNGSEAKTLEAEAGVVGEVGEVGEMEDVGEAMEAAGRADGEGATAGGDGGTVAMTAAAVEDAATEDETRRECE